MRPKRYCSVAGCDLPVKGLGFCDRHYQRFKKGQDPHTTQDRSRKTCCVDGCDEFVHAHGYCHKHWQRKTRYGKDPHATLPRDLDDIGKFKLKYRESEGCWEWIGRKDAKGYGTFTARDGGVKNKRAHRMAYELAYGPIPDKMLVCHKCDNPSCVNPSHLFLGTDSDNMVDMVKKNRHSCGREKKIFADDISAIRKLAKEMSMSAIAMIFGVSKSNIQAIVNRRTWKHVK